MRTQHLFHHRCREVVDAVRNAPFGPEPVSTTEASIVKGPVTKADSEILSVPYEKLQSPNQLEAWAKAQARAGNFQAASKAISDAIAIEPNNTGLLQTLATIRFMQGNYKGALDVLSEAKGKIGTPKSLPVTNYSLRSIFQALKASDARLPQQKDFFLFPRKAKMIRWCMFG